MDSVEEQLGLACEQSRAEEVSALLRDHPDLEINYQDETGHTALHRALNATVAKLLLAHPTINVNIQNPSGQTAFFMRCHYGGEVIRLLKDPRVDITLPDNNGCAPLWCASCPGRFWVVEWLIASGGTWGTLPRKGGIVTAVLHCP